MTGHVRADHEGTTITFALLGAPDSVTKKGLPFISDKARVHVWALGAYVWVEGRAVRRDGTIIESNRHRRGVGFDLAGDFTHRTWRDAPDWVRETIIEHPAVRALLRALVDK